MTLCDAVCVVAGFGEGDRAMREDREDRDAYRRMDGKPTYIVKSWLC